MLGVKNINLASLKKSNFLLIAIFVGTILGCFLGVLFPEAMSNWDWVGDLFVKSLKMLVVPLIFFSIVAGISNNITSEPLGKVGRNTVIYYFATTGIAVSIGIIMVNLLEPGLSLQGTSGFIPDIITEDKMSSSFMDIIKGMISPNIFWSMSSKSPQIMPIIIFAILLGVALRTVKSSVQTTVEVISTVNQLILQIFEWIFWLAPIGIFALLASKVGKSGGWDGLYSLISGVSQYFFTVLIALAIHGGIIIPLIYKFFTKQKPHKYFINMLPALGTAFSTASSSATLPLTMKQVTIHNAASKRVSSLVLPLGATINMDGTALYEAIAAMTIAQAYGIDLSITQQIIIFITANLAAIGAAGIPQAGLVTMILVLQSVGLPVEGIGIILSIDWLLDRFRTTVNVWGDTVGAAVVEKVLKI